MTCLNDYIENCQIKGQTVTLFMLTYRRPYYLQLAIKAALKQSYKNYYLIVLDNNSKDNTREVVQSFNDERLIYIEHESKSNFRYAFSIARTKYMVVLHDDDVLDDKYLETMLSVLDKHPDVDLLSCLSNKIDSDGLLLKKGGQFDGIKEFVGDQYLVEYYLKRSWKYSNVYPAVVYKTSFFSDIYYFYNSNVGPAVDQYLYFQTGRMNGIIAQVGIPLINYRIHKSQDSTANKDTLNLKLMRSLFADDYYNSILIQNYRFFYRFIFNSMVFSLKKYNQGLYTKDDLKKVYSLVPLEMRKGLRNRIYCDVFSILTRIPCLFQWFYRLYQLIKKSQSTH